MAWKIRSVTTIKVGKPTHQITDDDFNGLGRLGITNKFSKILELARHIGRQGFKEDMSVPLHTLHVGKYAQLGASSQFAQKVIDDKASS